MMRKVSWKTFVKYENYSNQNLWRHEAEIQKERKFPMKIFSKIFGIPIASEIILLFWKSCWKFKQAFFMK